MQEALQVLQAVCTPRHVGCSPVRHFTQLQELSSPMQSLLLWYAGLPAGSRPACPRPVQTDTRRSPSKGACSSISSGPRQLATVLPTARLLRGAHAQGGELACTELTQAQVRTAAFMCQVC